MNEWTVLYEADEDTDPEDIAAEAEQRERTGPLYTLTLRLTCNPGYADTKTLYSEILESFEWLTDTHDGIRKIEVTDNG